jgi:ribonuclease P protein component
MNTFKKEERLHGHTLIKQLITEGKGITVFPFKVIYLKKEREEKSILQAGFSVSKRRFKRAVDRNLIKRRMREAYRLNKSGLTSSVEKGHSSLFILFIYLSNEKLPYVLLKDKITIAIQRLHREYERHS